MRRQVHKSIRVKTDPEGMFRVKYPDGELSADYYNLTRAKNHARVLNDIDRGSMFR